MKALLIFAWKMIFALLSAIVILLKYLLGSLFTPFGLFIIKEQCIANNPIKRVCHVCTAF